MNKIIKNLIAIQMMTLVSLIASAKIGTASQEDWLREDRLREETTQILTAVNSLSNDEESLCIKNKYLLFQAKLTEEIMLAINTKVQLKSLTLESCTIADNNWLKHLSSLKNLTYLDLYQTDVNNTGLLILSENLPKLEILMLHNCSNIEDDDVISFGRFTNLVKLDLSDPGGFYITKTINANVPLLTKLIYLNLNGKRITNETLKNIQSIDKLVVLEIQACVAIDDDGLLFLKPHKYLISLNMSYGNKDKISNAGIANLEALENLKYLNIRGYGNKLMDGINKLKESRPGKIEITGGSWWRDLFHVNEYI
jgi:hypothetical protein